MNSRSRTARLPPAGLAGLDPKWSCLVTAQDHTGIERTWHVLDTGPTNGGSSRRGTVVCVHGNPNWSYMWRGLASKLVDWRVIAVDALNMGYSERTGEPRRLTDHVSDLISVTEALHVEGPVVTVAHDWGGPISMGWAQHNLDRLAGIVLMNTGVARPAGVRVPSLISVARSTLRATCETTPTFLHGALRMARPQLPRDIYRSYAAPYGEPALRTGIRDFVEDIPMRETHPTHTVLGGVAAGLEQMSGTPALLLWGARDIVFSDAFLADVVQRLPHADVHRYADAGHQIIEDTDAAAVIHQWLATTFDNADEVATLSAEADGGAALTRVPLWSAIAARNTDDAAAIVEMDPKDSGEIARSISFAELHARVQATAAGLAAAGIRPGHRLASLVPPGIDLTVLVYACLRAGVIVVAPDAALGLDGLRRALRSSRPDFVVGDWRGLALAKSLRLPATRLSVDRLPRSVAKAAGTIASLDELTENVDAPMLAEPAPGDPAAIVFTSGSTGPSKGVVYTHGQLEAQRDAVIQAFAIEPSDKLVVAFAPFAVLAPAIGITSVIPTIDVTAPAKLDAQTLAHAAAAIEATIVFASPAVLGTIAATASEVDGRGRQALGAVTSVATAGAPVSPQLLAVAQPVFANAIFATPYGMTEVLPVTVASTTEIESTDAEPGVCVGLPLPQVDVAIRSFEAASGTMISDVVGAGELGEVWVRAAHGCAGYDRLWAKQHHAFVDGWHRSGDVGHLDHRGRLWIEGRVDHLIHGPAATLAPVPIELGAESVPGVERAAAVGIGPVGTQQLAVVVSGPAGSDIVADAALTAAVRNAVAADVAAVLVAPDIPVDRRHNSKIDRARVQTWAAALLGGKSRARL